MTKTMPDGTVRHTQIRKVHLLMDFGWTEKNGDDSYWERKIWWDGKWMAAPDLFDYLEEMLGWRMLEDEGYDTSDREPDWKEEA